VQFGHETLDIADALRVLSFERGENADPNNLVIVRDVVEAMVEAWLKEVGRTYGAAERERLEPSVYPSVPAVYFTLAVRFYDSFLTGDSYFTNPDPQNNPGLYLQLAEVQMAQAEAFIRAFADKPGMADLARQVGSSTGLEEKEMSRRQFLKAVEVWKDISVTPAYEGIRIRLLPVFYSTETFQGIPLVAKGRSPFLVIASSQAEEDAVLSLLDGLDIGRRQYRIWRRDLREQDLLGALAAVRKEFADYAPYPVDPREDWLKNLLAILQEEGMIPVGDLGPALQATERYFQRLA